MADHGGYVHKPGERHVCPLPAEWVKGAVWRCHEGHLWTVDTACGTCRWLGKGEGGARHVHTIGHAWWPAGWWQRLLHRGRKATLGMANEHRMPGLPKGAPAGSESTPDYDG